MNDLDLELAAVTGEEIRNGNFKNIKQCANLIFAISALTPYEAATKANDLFKEKVCYKVALRLDDYSNKHSFELTLEAAERSYERQFEFLIKEDCLAFIRDNRKENEK